MTAAYPASILSWTARFNSETVWAADPNSLADEIDAIEQYVGPNPQVESSARTGGTVTFANMSARLSDAMLQRGHPFVEIARTSNWEVPHSSASGASGSHSIALPFNSVVSAWGSYVQSGGKIIIKDAGVWLINAFQRWQYASSGWVLLELYSNSGVLRRDIASYSQFPANGSNAYGERFLNLDLHNEVTFVGRLPAGAVISCASGNFTNVNPLQVQSAELSMYWLRP